MFRDLKCLSCLGFLLLLHRRQSTHYISIPQRTIESASGGTFNDSACQSGCRCLVPRTPSPLNFVPVNLVSLDQPVQSLGNRGVDHGVGSRSGASSGHRMRYRSLPPEAGPGPSPTHFRVSDPHATRISVRRHCEYPDSFLCLILQLLSSVEYFGQKQSWCSVPLHGPPGSPMPTFRMTCA